jgi:hypothetical protein
MGRDVSAMAAAVIPVYWHATTNTSGQGAPTPAQVQAQMDVLNNAFGSSGFSFVLMQVNEGANNSWYTINPGSTAESQVKNALQVGSTDTLNL